MKLKSKQKHYLSVGGDIRRRMLNYLSSFYEKKSYSQRSKTLRKKTLLRVKTSTKLLTLLRKLRKILISKIKAESLKPENSSNNL